ncbi:MAG: radical SAM protein [Spirochaetes bacterium]|nr:radical SAM protein [Spirochaetota bacterium]
MKPLICLIQPPFVQLNSPYPSIYYLRAFLEKRGWAVTVRDHSISLFQKIFCKDGLARIFADIAAAPKERFAPRLKPVIERFLAEEKLWLSSVDRLVAFLQGNDREFAHFAALANGGLPGGPYFDACLEEIAKAKGEPDAGDAPLLASKLLADVAALIAATVDPGFSLVRYVPQTAGSFRDFSAVEKGLGGYILKNFYEPLLQEEWEALAGQGQGGEGDALLVLGLTIPFPGCLAGAMFCASSAKKFFGKNVQTLAGGGYVNTELRFLTDEAVFDYFDYLCFDRGYAALDAVLDRITAGGGCRGGVENPLYKTMYRNECGLIVRDASIADKAGGANTAHGKKIDDGFTDAVFPDYTGVDFSRYICPVDDANSMHRLWSDGRWLKVYAAHGCYWQKCAFCDTPLDYIRCYRKLDAQALFRHLVRQAEATGVRGIHLVDEACPPASLLRLALLNRDAGLPLSFWGNIRFEKFYSSDVAAALAAGGVIALSAGIEVAHDKALERVTKGISLKSIAASCAAFKEAGILVHAYLIYGFWDQSDGEIIDSAEVMRQFFAAGLLDSAFWHQFVLTVHSPFYAQQQEGRHPSLFPASDATAGGGKVFAHNDLSFKGAARFDRFALPLDSLLKEWMSGDTEKPLREAFAFKTPAPAVPKDAVLLMLDSYARNRDEAREAEPPAGGKQVAVFLPAGIVIRKKGRSACLFWRWRFDDCVLEKTSQAKDGWEAEIQKLLEESSRGPGTGARVFYSRLEKTFGLGAAQVWRQLRRQGLVILPFSV